MLHCVREPRIHRPNLAPRHADVLVIGIFLRSFVRRSRFVSVETALEAVVYPLVPWVADAWAIPVLLL